MIGDWVYANGEPHLVSVLVRYCDDNHDVTDIIGCQGIGKSGEVTAVEFEPIPLTAEILEANFGEKEDHNCGEGYYFYGGNDGENCVVDGTLIIGRTSYDEYDLALPVRYVHELQHALRLCGLDELADNFVMPQ